MPTNHHADEYLALNVPIAASLRLRASTAAEAPLPSDYE
jgi:hypothetical protein